MEIKKRINNLIGKKIKRLLIIILVFCFLVGNVFFGAITSYAADNERSFNIGENVIAYLNDGVLTVSGQGNTYDYNHDNAPFSNLTNEIDSLVINEGVSTIGDYLFYGLGNLKGELVLPSSIMKIGDYSFSGDDFNNAAQFTIIKNEFVGIGAEKTNSNSESEYLISQEIDNLNTVFYKGQSGGYLCTNRNQTFINMMNYAGYQKADSFVSVTLDDQKTLMLPVLNGQIVIPKWSDDLVKQQDDTPFYSYEFIGWKENDEVLVPDTNYNINEKEQIKLYSSWKQVEKYELDIKVTRERTKAKYTLVDHTTQKPLDNIDGYTFLYQWQESNYNEENWQDIKGANALTYEHALLSSDINKQYRCIVTLEKLTRSLNEPVKLYSNPVMTLTTVYQVYISASGSDANNGTENNPVKTITQAAQLIKSYGNNSAEQNEMILLDDYTLPKAEIDGTYLAVPVTIKGQSKSEKVKLNGDTSATENNFTLGADIIFDNLSLNNIGHIYGNGHNITINDNVTSSGSLYLYGSGRQEIKEKIGEITVNGGNITRIIGYIRSYSNCDALERQSKINIGGNANVTLLVAGSASGSIKNANVEINIKGGKVATLVGGCQGFESTAANYVGHTVINVNGGTVKNLYGAGTGRQTSIPTYLGDLDINVKGGVIDNLYGSGAAAYVTSQIDNQSMINISATDGKIGNIYAAGEGWYSTLDNIAHDEGSLDNCGSLVGSANIKISDKAQITGDIHASGKGYKNDKYNTKKNAYLDGDVTIEINGGEVQGNIYGGGAGFDDPNYEECARVTENSTVAINLLGGTVKGNIYGGGKDSKVLGESSINISNGIVEGTIYGGGQKAEVTGKTSITVAGGTIRQNIYGGGQEGTVTKRTEVNINNGTINGSVYGGAKGITNTSSSYNGSTVNMSGGWIRGNLYGGSELSNDGQEITNGQYPDLIFVNLVGGTVSGKVFGGGYQGTVYGSTHLHVGINSLNDCKYYNSEQGSIEKPQLNSNSLLVNGSIYAGGDFGGGETIDYDAITVKGYSHVYIDGLNYDFTSSSSNEKMDIRGGVFGSGASCDAGDIRLITLRNFGSKVYDNGDIVDATTLSSIQRADQVRIIESHIRLTGESDVANANPTAPYSMNRIGDHGTSEQLGELGNGLILENGSTLILDSAAIEIANCKSMKEDLNSSNDNLSEVTVDDIKTTPNTIKLATGTVFRIGYTLKEQSTLKYGAVRGYSYLLVEESAQAYAYARLTNDTIGDGGFVDSDGHTLEYTDVTNSHRYWKVGASSNTTIIRNTVLIASKQDNLPNDDFAITTGEIELPPIENNSIYTISNIKIPSELSLIDATKSKDLNWQTAGNNINQDIEKEKINTNPLNTFGLYMSLGSGFTNDAGKLVSNGTASSGENSIINHNIIYSVSDNVTPKVNFTLTYLNNGITKSQDFDPIEIKIEHKNENSVIETIIMKVEIVTKTTFLSAQTVDLYATQSGSYSGQLIIPSGMSRDLQLTKIDKGSVNLVSQSSTLESNSVAITMQPLRSNGWQSADLLESPYDLYNFQSPINIGTTDSRYDATINFTLYNNPNFNESSDTDIVLTLNDGSNEVSITLKIHWQSSIVSEMAVASGKQYNEFIGSDSISITSQSAITVSVKIGAHVNYSDIWLELQQSKSKVKIPKDTKFTLLVNNEFYTYTVVGNEVDNKLMLSEFTKMSDKSQKLSGSLLQNNNVTIIMDLNAARLNVGDYSFRLRTNNTADSMGANFTINNSTATVNIGETVGLSKGIINLNLDVFANTDTRFGDKLAVVLYNADNTKFPEGVIFRYNNQVYVPIDGKVYIKLNDSSKQNIIIDSSNSKGLSNDMLEIAAEVYAIGLNTNSTSLQATTQVSIENNPSYSLGVAINGSRMVKSNSEVKFNVNYLITDPSENVNIQVDVFKKDGDSYNSVNNWMVTENALTSTGFNKEFKVNVPSGALGTYRLIFKLGDQEVPYNIIVDNS